MLSLDMNHAVGEEPSERNLYARMIARALRDVMGAVESQTLHLAEKEENPTAQRRLEKAQFALGWIFDDVEAGPDKARCGGEPCPPEPGLDEEPCRSWNPGNLCRRVTFEEACHGMSPDLSPEALRERVLGIIREAGLDLA